jgi:Na+-translocating ferredoxin:NAD+ oxidoreductase RNF subunit RnfB
MDISLDTIFELLPKRDCGDCSERSCRQFAYKLAVDPNTVAGNCPHLSDHSRATLDRLKALFGHRKRVALIVEEDRCTACNECVVICPVNTSMRRINNEASMPLAIDDDVVKVRRHCGALHWCVKCVEICPVDAIKLV